MTTCVAKKFARYLRNTRAVSALEYAILVGIAAVVASPPMRIQGITAIREANHLPGC